MTTATVQLASICSGGNHLTFNVTGDVVLTRVIDLAALSVPPTQEDSEVFLRVISWMAKSGRTLAQAKTLLQNGVTITI